MEGEEEDGGLVLRLDGLGMEERFETNEREVDEEAEGMEEDVDED